MFSGYLPRRDRGKALFSGEEIAFQEMDRPVRLD